MDESRQVARLLDEMERQGWVVRVILGGKARLWCACTRRHCVWVLLYPADEYTVELRRRLARSTCFDDEEDAP